MKCPRCGNEVSREEAFCGQCGAPNTPPAQPTEMVSAPPPPVNGRSSGYAALPPAVQGAPRTRQLTGNNAGTSYPDRAPQSGGLRSSGPNQGTGFYHDATEAMSLPGSLPGQIPPTSNFPGPQPSQMPPGNYPGTGQYGGPVPGNYPANTFSAPAYIPQPQMGGTGQAYLYDQGGRGKIATPPVKQQNNLMVLFVSLCVIIALVSVIGLGTVILLRGRSGGGEQTGTNGNESVATATIAPTATPTTEPAATPTPTVDAVTPTPLVSPTAVPDAGFQWCAPACTALGYQIEYPVSWSPGAIPNVQGYQYVNPAAPDEIAAVKAGGQTASQASDLLSSDLQTNFQSKPGYTAPTAAATSVTIGGTTWLAQTVYYQSQAQQQVRVLVFATVYQQKAYIIELQANNAQFDTVYQQAFAAMLKSFTFQAIPTA